MADKKDKGAVQEPEKTSTQATLANTKEAPSEASSSTSMLRLSEIPSPKEKWKVLGSREAIQLLNPRAGSPGLRLNGKPDLNRSDQSLLAPGSKDKLNKSGSELGDDKPGSRPSSARSGNSALSSLNLSGVQHASAHQTKEPKEEKSKTTVLNTDTDYKSAIPFLPQWLAVICLIINTLIPGLGTMLSGLAIFCCGKPRIYSKEGNKVRTLCANLTVGTMQLFTVPFMLVGWFWSLVWGIYMVILSIEYKNSEKAKREKELQAKALTALNANLRPWTLMRS